MKFITVTELKLKATQVVAEIERSREQVVVTKNGKPVVVIQLVSDSDFKLKEKQKGKEVKKHGKRTV
jgi:prevent-host-death family protein